MNNNNQGIRLTRYQEARQAWRLTTEPQKTRYTHLLQTDTLVLSYLKKQVKEHEALIRDAISIGRKDKTKRKEMKKLLRVCRRDRLDWLIRYERAKEKLKRIKTSLL